MGSDRTDLPLITYLLLDKFFKNVKSKISNVARMGEKSNAYRIFVWKPEGRRPLGRPRRRYVENIKMDLGEPAWGWYELDRSGSG
jgi:hypothetical protein